MNTDYSIYFSGEKLYGDDFTIEQIEQWYTDEAEGYADLGAKEKERYRYVYHQLNYHHAFKFLRDRQFTNALGVGSAYGEEFKPICGRIEKLTILDPSDAFSEVTSIFGKPCKYIKPHPGGNMPFEGEVFDLITCLGVLHHIPNVSFVMSECHRCMKNGGIMLLREPIVSMGDWREPRTGLTKRERGIPAKLLDEIVEKAGFTIARRSYCVFRPIPAMTAKFGIAAYNSASLTIADKFLSKLLSRTCVYHRTRLIQKFSPASIYYVLEKNS